MLTSILSHFFLFHFSIKIIQWLLKVIYSYINLLKLHFVVLERQKTHKVIVYDINKVIIQTVKCLFDVFLCKKKTVLEGDKVRRTVFQVREEASEGSRKEKQDEIVFAHFVNSVFIRS